MNTKTIRKGKDIVIIKTDWEGGHLQGEVQVPYATIVKTFGRQNTKGDTYKTDAEWEINTPAGKGSIYNYKDGRNYCGKEGLAIKDITDWHIGGQNQEIYEFIKSEIAKNI